MDINEIKAGEYQLVVVRWDERTSKPGEPFTFVRHRRGDVVELDEAEARRLVLAGAVVKPGELERQAAEAARRQYQALLSQMPDVLRRQLLAEDASEALIVLQEAASGGAPEEEDGTVDAAGPAKPPPLTANRDAWVDYRVAESQGRLTKEQLNADGGPTRAQLQNDAYVAALTATPS